MQSNPTPQAKDTNPKDSSQEDTTLATEKVREIAKELVKYVDEHPDHTFILWRERIRSVAQLCESLYEENKRYREALEKYSSHEEHCSFGSPNRKTGGTRECDCFLKIAQQALTP